MVVRGSCVLFVLTAATFIACRGSLDRAPGARAIQATSLLGAPLVAPRVPPARRAALERDLAAAEAEHRAHPESEEAAIWHGRRLAYLGRYRDAITVYTDALRRSPDSFRLLRHRGHRFITVRELDAAIADLERAAELARGVPDAVEPDGAPNARGIPRSTTQSNIWYHLGLARYLAGRFGSAADAWREGIAFARVNDDMLVATSYWLYLALRRSNAPAAEAASVLGPIRPDMDVIENHEYHRLLLMFKGVLAPDQIAGTATVGDTGIADATIGYGLGVRHLLEGDAADARASFERVIRAPDANWAAFGFIAAEAELARRP